MIDYKIYVVYHKDSQLDMINKNLDYKNNDHYILYPNHKNIDGINLNYLHDTLNEFCAMYYVWKNHKYSRYIGFNQYKRHLHIYENLINDDICYVHTYHPILGYTIKNHYVGTFGDDGEKIFNIYINILDKLYGKNNIYSNFLNNSTETIWDSIYLMSYSKFENLCKLLFTVYDEFNKITNINYDINKCIKFHKNNNWLMRAHMLERLTSAYILNIFKKQNIIAKYIYDNNIGNSYLYNKRIS